MAGGRGSGEASRDEIAGLLGDARLQGGMMLRFGLAALLAVPFWHAPALALWAGQGVGQSLISSTLACWRAIRHSSSTAGLSRRDPRLRVVARLLAALFSIRS